MKIPSSAISDVEFIPPLELLSCPDNGRPAGDHHQHQHHSPSNLKLDAVLPPAVASSGSSYSSRFKVPKDGRWIAKKVLRRDGRTDKYYIEAETGTKFRSSKEVERYIKDGEYPSRSGPTVSCSSSYLQDRRYAKCIMRGGKAIRLDEEEYNQKQQLCANARISINDLPDGWVIEEVPRRSGGSDRYYYEPGTGRKFRSLVAVARHLEEEDVPLSPCIEDIKENAPLSKAFKLHHKGKAIRLDEEEYNQKQLCANARISINDLPDGWVIEEFPRRLGGFDRYYYEPGTGRKFRSFVAVVRHLEEEDVPLSPCIEDFKENAPLSKAFKLDHKAKNVSRKRNLTTSSNGDDEQTSSAFVSPPPKKIKWILGSSSSSSEGDVWSPFIRGILVPDSMKHQWNRSFMAVMKDADGN